MTVNLPSDHQLLYCPFCGNNSDIHFKILGKVWTGSDWSTPTSVEISHACPKIDGQPNRSVVRVGRDLESAISAWNMRATKNKSIDERAAFESAFQSMYPGTLKQQPHKFSQLGTDNDYDDPVVLLAWKFWKARAAI
jgi:hypothetical protein